MQFHKFWLSFEMYLSAIFYLMLGCPAPDRETRT